MLGRTCGGRMERGEEEVRRNNKKEKRKVKNGEKKRKENCNKAKKIKGINEKGEE